MPPEIYPISDLLRGWIRAAKSNALGTLMTVFEISMLVSIPSVALVALLLCKPAFRPRLALYRGDEPDLLDEPPLAEAEQTATI